MLTMTLDDSQLCAGRPSLIKPSRPNAQCLDCSRRDAFPGHDYPYLEPKWGRVAGSWQCLDRRSSGAVGEHAASVCGSAAEGQSLEVGGGMA